MTSWSAIVGAPGTQKGRAAKLLSRMLGSRGLRVAGFVQEEVCDANGEVTGWDVESVSTPERRTVLARTRTTDPTICGYAFEPDGFAAARAFALEPADVVIVGGVGKLEAAKQGHFPLLAERCAATTGPHVVLCIRDTCLASIAFELPDPIDHVQLPCDTSELERLAATIAASLGDARPHLPAKM